jgi:hypothetical protein
MRPDGPTAQLAQPARMAHWPSQPFPFSAAQELRATFSPFPSGRRARRCPRRRAHRRRRSGLKTWTRRWGAPRLRLFPLRCSRTPARLEGRPADHPSRRARRDVAARRARPLGTAEPWARWGAAGRVPGARSPARPTPSHGLDVERSHTVTHGRRGHGHGALGCGQPAPAPTCTQDLLKPRVEARITTRLRAQPNARPATERRHGRDARSAPVLEGAARRGATRRDAGTRSLPLQNNMARRPNTHIHGGSNYGAKGHA